MSLILDGIIVLIVALYIYFSMSKGFVRILVELVGYVLSIVIALNLGGMLANYVFDSHIEPAANTALKKAVAEKTSDAIDAVPDYIDAFLLKANVDLESVCNSDNVDVSAVTGAIKPFAVEAIKSVAAIIIFIVLLFVVKILARFINSLFSGFIFGPLNKALGAIFGGLKGVIIACTFSLLVYFIASASVNDFFIFSDKVINDSTLCRVIIDYIL